MENQHRKIKGYRELDQVEINLMNKLKEKEAETLKILKELEEYNQDANKHLPDETRAFFDKAEPHRWLQIGRTQIQQGFMAAVRAVAKPPSK